jgi:hypothetical protein
MNEQPQRRKPGRPRKDETESKEETETTSPSGGVVSTSSEGEKVGGRAARSGVPSRRSAPKPPHCSVCGQKHHGLKHPK